MQDAIDRRDAPQSHRQREPESDAGRAARRYRIVAAVALAVIATSILTERPWTVSIKDALYWLVVASMILARHCEERAQRQRVAVESQAARARLARYAAGLVAVAACVWTIAQCSWVREEDPSRIVEQGLRGSGMAQATSEAFTCAGATPPALLGLARINGEPTIESSGSSDLRA